MRGLIGVREVPRGRRPGHVSLLEEADPDAGRLTKDIDITVRRDDLERIAKAVEPFGLVHRHVAGVDMLVQVGEPSARRAVHFGVCR